MAEERVPIDQKIQRELQKHRKRTNIGAISLLKGRELPDGLSAGIVSSWLSGRAKSASPSLLSYVLELWRSLPDASGKRTYPLRPGRIHITPAMIREMKQAWERTGVGPYALVTGSKMLRDLNPKIVSLWMCGSATTARKEQFDRVMEAWSIPMLEERPTMDLTDKHLQTLLSLLEETNFNLPLFFKRDQYAPDGLTLNVVRGWLRGTTKTVRKKHYNYMVKILTQQRDTIRANRLPLDQTD